MNNIKGLFKRALLSLNSRTFKSSKTYWESRYKTGGDSGSGSYGRLAQFKARIINDLIKRESIASVVEWGCGDGHNLSLYEMKSYVGLDISETAIKMCQKAFTNDNSKAFYQLKDDVSFDQAFDLALSLDVIYHLVEDSVFEKYMHNLFESSKKLVCIYSSNADSPQCRHIKKRNFTDYVETNIKTFRLINIIKNDYPYDANDPENTSISDFYIYEIINPNRN